MFTLLTPSALLALLGFLVPVAIHLWNRRPGREVAVGSLRWLTAGANRRLRNLKLEQLWLLLLRAALLGVLALALAGPVWRHALPGGRGQVLLSPEVLGAPAFAALRPTIDSLRRRGYALRWLAAGFPKVSGAAWRADSMGRRDSARVLATAGLPPARLLWARVTQAADAFRGQPLLVVTPATLHGFEGPHPPLGKGITWQTLPNPAVRTWVQAAAMRGDSVRLLVGRSTENQTTFRLKSVKRPADNSPMQVAGIGPLRIETHGAERLIVTPGSVASPAKQELAVPISSRPLRIVIYTTADYGLDSRYLQAGLRAAATGLLVPLQLEVVASPPAPGTPPDWLFWLSEAPLPPAWREAAQRGTHVLQEASGPGVAKESHLVAGTVDEASATILRRTAGAAAPGSLALWTDGLGQAVLLQRLMGEGALYQLNTRLNPTWSDLADSPAFPAHLLELIQPETGVSPALDHALASQDQRAIDATQLPTRLKADASLPSSKTAPKVFRVTDLRPWLVLVAGLLFLLERLEARRESSIISPAS